MPDARTESPGAAAPPRPSRARLFLLTLAAALVFGVLEAAQGRFFYRDLSNDRFWPEALTRTLPSWIILTLLVPLVMALARTVRLDRHRAPWAIPLYLVAGGVFVMLHLGGSAAFEAWRHHGEFDYYVRWFLMRHAVMDYTLYLGIVSAIHFVRHQDELRARERAEAELRTGLVEARLTALRAQLHPHFLFNTLNAIHALALTGDREQLVATIRALSDLLRFVLDETPGHEATLESEMRFLDRYLEIQRVRFGARLRVEFDVPAETLAARVPSLLLQPLVENALEHGLERKAGPGIVAFRARRDGATLELRIEDSGPGFPTGEGLRGGHGVGLSNTRLRLEQLYGPSTSLACENLPAGGARVTVRLPWDTTVTPERADASDDVARPASEARRAVSTPREARA